MPNSLAVIFTIAGLRLGRRRVRSSFRRVYGVDAPLDAGECSKGRFRRR